MLTNRLALGAAALLGATPIAAAERAVDFVLVNATGAAISGVSIRRFGTGAWHSLAVLPSSGERRAVKFNDEDCAFDIQATLERDTVLWPAINLCEAKAVILQRDASGCSWVDYV